MKFPHLITYSAYSAHYGVSAPAELVVAAVGHGATHLGLTDRDGLYGAVKHVRACMDHGVTPVLGVDLALADPSDRKIIGRIVLLADGHDAGAGYGDLCQIITRAHRTRERTGPTRLGDRPRITAADLGRAVAMEEGRFTVLLGPESDYGRLAEARKYRAARASLKEWRKLVGERRLRVNLVNHLTRPGERRSVAHAARMLGIAAESRVGAVVSNAVRYATEDQAVTADVLDAARSLTALGEGIQQVNGQGWLKPAQDMGSIAAEIARAADAGITASDLTALAAELAHRCAIDPATDMGYGTPTVPEAHLTGVTRMPAAELRARCEAALERVYGAEKDQKVHGPGLARRDWETPRERLDRELRTIENLGFCSYFLTVGHVSGLIESLGIRHAARGSGVSSLVNYLLNISVVDPLEYGLVFERFLSDKRSTLPDIDIDVESARRHEIYRLVFDHYGDHRVSLMSMHNGYRARGAVRDAARAIGLTPEQTDRIAKTIWRVPAGELRELLDIKPELAELRREAREDPKVNLLIDLTERLDRLPRHLSMHPCGVILSNASLLRRTPVQPSGMGLPMSQFDKHDMDPMGLLKLDILGVRMQSSMAYTLQEIERTEGHKPDLETIDTRDPKTFDLIQSTQTLGCFQIESPGQRELIGKMQPSSVGDLIIDISLFRPGPMQSDMVRPYLESRHGFATPNYIEEDLVPYLEETAGVMVFHEQILNVFSTMTGCDLASSDEFRRKLGSTAQDDVEEHFRLHSARRGYSREVIDKTWTALAAFGSFGFCKAHGAAFAIPTYQSAWLKTHYPAHFMTGLLEHDPGMYPQRLILAEARRLGIELLPLDVNRSGRNYRVERVVDSGADSDLGVGAGVGRGLGRGVASGRGAETGRSPGAERWGIRLPLTQLSGISGAEIDRITARAPYVSVADLKARARPHKPTLDRLAAVGALDVEVFRGVWQQGVGGGGVVRAAGGGYDDVVPRPTETGARSGEAGAVPVQLSLPLGAHLETPYESRDTSDVTSTVRTELDLLALDVSAHLMVGYRDKTRTWPLTRAADLIRMRNKSEVWVAGVRVSTMTPPMKNGKRVVFISLDDGTGCVDTAFFDEAQKLSGPDLFGTPMILIRGTTRRTGPRGISLTALQAWDLTALVEGETPLPFPPSALRKQAG
ncbi:DNA polymerase III subunit alpha [Kocuria sp. TGY1127_2]|uniref:DNA polymerase III subunit alpha n=1 Tax=Kocuria sp. TGY1127_2 TaxID=2711328 RepID=UPI0015C17917|nr:DNA polymerase III subunit alpha [Kocuria sp. TGY1127_2]